MTETASQTETDLFGHPVGLVRDRWGRPKFRKTIENQRTVSVLVARGWTQQRIADYIGCDPKTLRKNFSRELQAGADLIEGMALEVLLHKVVGGDRIAATKLIEFVGEGRLKPVQPKQPNAENVGKLGKKETLAEEAKTPPGSWQETLGTKH